MPRNVMACIFKVAAHEVDGSCCVIFVKRLEDPAMLIRDTVCAEHPLRPHHRLPTQRSWMTPGGPGAARWPLPRDRKSLDEYFALQITC
jgi:hypothetical protein